MKQDKIDWVAVVDDDGRFSGWFVASDVKEGLTVEDTMRPSPITASESAVLSESLSHMLTSGLKVLAIVDRHNRLEGVLTFEAIQEALRKVAQKEKRQ